jgi:DnaJ-class molecular chaperone
MTDKKKLEEAFDELEYEDEICSWCSGSGEGMYDGATCGKCHGSGVEPVEKDEDDCYD